MKTESKLIIFYNGSLVFDIGGNSQKLITYNETCLIIAISDIII